LNRDPGNVQFREVIEEPKLAVRDKLQKENFIMAKLDSWYIRYIIKSAIICVIIGAIIGTAADGHGVIGGTVGGIIGLIIGWIIAAGASRISSGE
jgi:hypothetical protein